MPDMRAVAARLTRSNVARGALAVLLVGVGALGATGLRVAERQAEITAPVVADLCEQGQAARVESIRPGACGTAATVEQRGAGGVTVAGPSGPSGEDGAAGEVGATGAPGAAGTAGAAGQPGMAGADGTPGVDGVNGAPGRDGISVQGEQGANGIPGRDGVDGAPGRDGVDGAPGLEGPPGRDGNPAETQTFTAPDGTKWTCSRNGGTDTAPSYGCTTEASTPSTTPTTTG